MKLTKHAYKEIATQLQQLLYYLRYDRSYCGSIETYLEEESRLSELIGLYREKAAQCQEAPLTESVAPTLPEWEAEGRKEQGA